MGTISTETAQNNIKRIEQDIFLDNVEQPIKIKVQYGKVKKAIIDLYTALDILNDMKDNP